MLKQFAMTLVSTCFSILYVFLFVKIRVHSWFNYSKQYSYRARKVNRFIW